MPKGPIRELLAIQMGRRVRRYGRFRVDSSTMGARASIILEHAGEGELPLGTLQALLSQCFAWKEELDRSRQWDPWELQDLLDQFVIVIQGFTRHENLEEAYINGDLLAAVEQSVDITFRFYSSRGRYREKEQAPSAFLSVLPMWIHHFWLSKRDVLGPVISHVQTLVEDASALLSQAGMLLESDELLLDAKDAGVLVEAENLAKPSSYSLSEVRAHGLSAIIAYQGLLAQGKEPDQGLYRIVMREFRQLKGASVPFPSLRRAAAAKNNKWFPLRRIDPDIIDAASPEQMFRLAVEGGDYELASALYKLLRAHRTFFWAAEDGTLFDNLFRAIVDYGFRRMMGDSRKSDFDAAMIYAGQLYLDWREDTQGLPTSHETADRLFTHVLPRMQDEKLFTQCLNSYLTEQQEPLSPRYATRFFRLLHRAHEKSTWQFDNLYNAMACFQQNKQHAAVLELSAYNFVLRSLVPAKQVDYEHNIERSQRVFEAIRSNNLVPNTGSYDLFFCSLSRGSDVHSATIVSHFEGMEREGIEPNVDIIVSVIRAYFLLEREELALDTLLEAVEDGIPMRDITASFFLDHLEEEERNEGMRLFAAWRDDPEPGPVPARLYRLFHGLQEDDWDVLDDDLDPVQSEKLHKADPERSRVLPPPVDSISSEKVAIATATADSTRGKKEKHQAQRHQEQSALANAKDSTFLATFFTPNGDQELSSSADSVAAASGAQELTDGKVTDAPSKEEAHASTQAGHSSTFRPPVPVSFASMALPAVSQAFSTSSRAAATVGCAGSTDPSTDESHLSSLAAMGSALANIPYYLADLTFPQLSGLFKRYRLEAEAEEREKELQEAIRLQVAQRADANRWRGWREAGAVPWY